MKVERDIIDTPEHPADILEREIARRARESRKSVDTFIQMKGVIPDVVDAMRRGVNRHYWYNPRTIATITELTGLTKEFWNERVRQYWGPNNEL